MALKPGKFLDPKSDIVFKRIFGENKDLVKSFLNSILPLEEDQLIQEIEYLPLEQTPRIPSLKNSIVDVKCRDLKGRIFIVEMQVQWSDSFAKRLQFGACKAYVHQLKKGEDYRSLHPVYALGIVNAIFDQISEEWYHHFKTVNVKNPEKTLEGLQLIFIELPKFKSTETWAKKLGIVWLRFLKELDETTTDVPEEFQDVPEVMKALELSQESSYSEAELEVYDRYLDAVRVESTLKMDAFDEGKAEGERQTKLALAQKLLKNGMPLDEVCDLVGLPIEEVSSFLKDNP